MVKDTARQRCCDRRPQSAIMAEVVFEIGFGQGRTVAALANAGHQVIGADPVHDHGRPGTSLQPPRRTRRCSSTRTQRWRATPIRRWPSRRCALRSHHPLHDRSGHHVRRDRASVSRRRPARARLSSARRRHRSVERPRHLPDTKHRRSPRTSQPGRRPRARFQYVDYVRNASRWDPDAAGRSECRCRSTPR